MDCELRNLHFIDAAFCDGKLLFYNRETKFFYSYDLTSETIGFIEVNGVDEFDLDVPRKVIRNKKFIYFILKYCINFSKEVYNNKKWYF